MDNGISMHEYVFISNDRFAELIQKEERLTTIERMLSKGKYVSVADMKIILDVKEGEEE